MIWSSSGNVELKIYTTSGFFFYLFFFFLWKGREENIIVLWRALNLEKSFPVYVINEKLCPVLLQKIGVLYSRVSRKMSFLEGAYQEWACHLLPSGVEGDS